MAIKDKEEQVVSGPTAPEPMTASEILDHPEFPYVTWLLTPTRKERIRVGRGRGGPFRIAYEIHGKGPTKMVWVMGMGSIKSAWQRQTKDFAHREPSKYSCLVYDNRGIGESDKPLMRYSTSEMAHDLIEVLDHIKWTGNRELHVVGISMGGMIAQELAMKIPKRIASLTLVSTGCRIRNTVGWMENLYNRAMLFIPRGIDTTLNTIKHNLYSDDYLHHPDELEYSVQPFPTNGDRCMAIELYKRLDPGVYPKHGFILQAIAAGWHYKSAAQLARLAAQVGHARIMVMHGTRDRMVSFPHGQELLDLLGGEQSGITKVFLEGQGHVIPIERRSDFEGWIKGLVQRTSEMAEEVEEGDLVGMKW